MTTLLRAADAKRGGSCSVPVMRSPDRFAGSLDELVEEYILPNLPSAATVARFHEMLVDYVSRDDALFLIRAVRGTPIGPIVTPSRQLGQSLDPPSSDSQKRPTSTAHEAPRVQSAHVEPRHRTARRASRAGDP